MAFSTHAAESGSPPGSYLFWLCETQKEQRDRIGLLIKEAAGQAVKILYLGSQAGWEWFRSDQNAYAEEVGQWIQAGHLEPCIADIEYRSTDDHWGLDSPWLDQQIHAAQERGYQSLLLLKDEEPSLERGADRENLFSGLVSVGQALRDRPCLLVWVLDVHQLDWSNVINIVYTQHQVGIGDRLYPNPDSVRPIELSTSPDIAVSVLRIIQNQLARMQLPERYQDYDRFIFNETDLGIALVNLSGKILNCNPAFEEMMGYGPGEVRYQSLESLVYPGEQTMISFDLLVRGIRETVRGDRCFLSKTGKRVWGRINASLVRTENATPSYVIFLVEDVTTRKQLESELMEVQHRLMQNRDQERLHIAQELHDGPLQDLYGLTFSLKDLSRKIEDLGAEEELSQLRAAVEQQIRNLRAFCSELRPPTLTPFGLEKAIRSHSSSVREAHPELDIHLDLMADGQLLPENVRIALYRIYQELFNNIIRHAHASLVTVRFILDDVQAVVEVSDNGKGFEVPERWIEVARQGHLGLLGAQERAEAAGGNLDILSKPGEGTTVRVWIPMEPSNIPLQL